MKRESWTAVAVLGLVPLACSLLPRPVPAATPPPTQAPAPSPEPTTAVVSTIPVPPTLTPLPAGTGPCDADGTAGFEVYTRPSQLADVFGFLSPDFGPVRISGRTADGWLGFDPGVAQAANIGVFRLRWIPPEAPIDLSGDCASVPMNGWTPMPGVCYQMSMGPVEVHSAADPASAVVHTLMIEEFVAIKGRTGTGWLFVDGNDGNTPGVVGFIPELEMNANGPCDSVPLLSP